MKKIPTADFDARHRQLVETHIALLESYAGEVAAALILLKEQRLKDPNKALSHEEIQSAIRMLGLGLSRGHMPSHLRDGVDAAKPEPPKPGARLKKLRIVG